MSNTSDKASQDPGKEGSSAHFVEEKIYKDWVISARMYITMFKQSYQI